MRLSNFFSRRRASDKLPQRKSQGRRLNIEPLEDRRLLSVVPTVTGLNLATGTTAGGTPVTITGTAFTGATEVDFSSGKAATNLTVVSDTTITCNSPAVAAGQVDVTVTTAGGTSAIATADHFTYTTPSGNLPTVTSLTVTTGALAGGTSVTIVGTNFVSGATVDFGYALATNVNVASATSITCTSPAGTGTVDVRVNTAGGTSAVATADKFTYTASTLPTVTALNLSTASTKGGGTLKITGTNLTGATAVNFGAVAVTTFQTATATEIDLTIPAGAAGLVDVTVTTPSGTSATAAADQFTYTAAGGASTVGLCATTNSQFYLRNSADTGIANTTLTYQPGTAGDSLAGIVGDWDGDGIATIGVYDHANGTFFLKNSNDPGSTAAATTIQFGPTSTPSTWLPVAGDWNNSGKDQVGLYDQATGLFHLDVGGTDVSFLYGPVIAAGNGLLPIAGRWASGATDATIGLYDPKTSLFFLRNSNDTGMSQITFLYGSPTNQAGAQINWKAVTGDWTGNGPDTIGLYDPAGSQFFLRNSNDSGFAQRTFVYGPATFNGTPLAGAWNASTVTGLTPATGSTVGGDSVKIAGAGFTGATAVKFGTTAATTFHVDSATQITATSPAGTAGAVDVTVTTIGGTSAIVTADKFTYVAAPAVTAVASTAVKGTYAPGAIIPITVKFGTAVTVTGTPTLDLNSKGTNTSAKATYTSTSADGLTLTFNYTVAAGDSTATGQVLDYTSTTALALSGGTIVNKAAPTINAALTLPATSTDGLAAQQIVIAASPTVLALSSTTAKGTYGPGTVIPITVTFSAPVIVTTTGGTPTLDLNSKGTNASTKATYSSTSTDGLKVTFNYTVAEGDSNSTGQVLDYTSTTALALNGGTIVDKAVPATNATLTLPATGTDGLATQQITITASPTVTAVASTTATGTYGPGTVIPITVKYSAPVTVTTTGGTPTLDLNSKGTNASTKATYSSISADGLTLTFNYTVAEGDSNLAGQFLDYTSTTALTLNGGAVADKAVPATNAALTLPAIGADGLATQQITITASPTVTAVASTAATGTYAPGAVIPITVTFSAPVTVTGTPTLDLNSEGTNASATATYSSTSADGLTLTFNYTVAAGDSTASGEVLDYTSTGALALGGGTIVDKAVPATSADLTLPATGTDGLAAQQIVIAASPTVLAVASTTVKGTYAPGAVIPITVTFSAPVIVTGTPTLDLNSKGTNASAKASYKSISTDGLTLTFDYTVAAGDSTATGLFLDYTSTGALALSGGTIVDKVVPATSATLTLPATGTDGLATQQIVIAAAPSVIAVSSTATAGAPGAVIHITVTFSAPVTVNTAGGIPTLDLNSKGTNASAVATYEDIITDGMTLTFFYFVAAGDSTPTGQFLDYTATGALALNGATIVDTTVPTTNATLTLPATGTDGLAAQKIVIGAAPTVTAIASTTAKGTYAAGAIIPITVTFSAPVTLDTTGGIPTLNLNSKGTNASAVATYDSGSGDGLTLTFLYTVSAGDSTPTGQFLDYTATGALALNGATIVDTAVPTTAANLTLPATGTDALAAQQIAITALPPSITAVGSTVTAGAPGAAIPITVTFNAPVTVTGVPTLSLNSKGTNASAVASYDSTSGDGMTLTFIYTVAAGDSTPTGRFLDYTSTSVSLPAGASIVDTLVGTTATVTLPTAGSAADGLAAQKIVIGAAPTVTAISSTAGTYTTGNTVSITVTFSAPVTVTGTPTLALNSKGTNASAVASYTTTSPDGLTLTFDYTVAAGDSAAVLDYTSTTALALSGGSIVDTTVPATNATLTLPTPGSATDGLAALAISIT